MPCGQPQLLHSQQRYTSWVRPSYLSLLSPLTMDSEMADPHTARQRVHLKLGGILGFTAGFLMAYQRSSCAHHFTHLRKRSPNSSFQCVSGDGRKTSERRRGIYRSLANAPGKESLCMASLPNLDGFNTLHLPIRNGRSSNSVCGLFCLPLPL
jgi:hypothetical protein